MSVQAMAYRFTERHPDEARTLITNAAHDAVPVGMLTEQVYLLHGAPKAAWATTHLYKIGRSRQPGQRKGQIGRRVFTHEWHVIHTITCFSDSRMQPSIANTCERMLHTLYRDVQAGTEWGKEYFALPADAVDFLKSLAAIDAIALNISLMDAYFARYKGEVL